MRKSSEIGSNHNLELSDPRQDYISNGRALNFTPVTKYIKSTRPYTGHPSTLPPLPPILSSSLASLPFTHQGATNGPTATKVHSSYERLEFLGDAYIEVIATRFLYTFFPNLPAGKLSQRRELCVKNQTLAEYATAYGFPERAQLPKSINKEGKHAWRKTMGDIFEAYVAAVILADPENGFQTAEAWLTTLWEYEVTKLQQTSIVESQNACMTAKTELARAIGGRNVIIDYRDEGPPEHVKSQGKIIFHIAIYLMGWNWENKYMGRGSGLNKQEAGAMAAADALRNPLLQEVWSVKKKYDAMVAEARERGEVPPPFKKTNGE